MINFKKIFSDISQSMTPASNAERVYLMSHKLSLTMDTLDGAYGGAWNEGTLKDAYNIASIRAAQVKGSMFIGALALTMTPLIASPEWYSWGQVGMAVCASSLAMFYHGSKGLEACRNEALTLYTINYQQDMVKSLQKADPAPGPLSPS